MTLEEEKRFAVLAGIVSLGGAGTKADVLDSVESHEWINFNSYDMSEKLNRSELVWRNDLAFIRKHLVEEGYVSDQRVNWWEITSSGQQYFLWLCKTVSNNGQFQKLAAKGVEYARERCAQPMLAGDVFKATRA